MPSGPGDAAADARATSGDNGDTVGQKILSDRAMGIIRVFAVQALHLLYMFICNRGERHGQTIFVTGATGQTGGNVCEQLIERGDHVRALVRNPDEATALTGIGVELVKGDIGDADDVLRAAKGAEAAIHCAALLGGASQDLEDFKAVNMVGTTNVLDAAKTTACVGSSH